MAVSMFANIGVLSLYASFLNSQFYRQLYARDLINTRKISQAYLTRLIHKPSRDKAECACNEPGYPDG